MSPCRRPRPSRISGATRSDPAGSAMSVKRSGDWAAVPCRAAWAAECGPGVASLAGAALARGCERRLRGDPAFRPQHTGRPAHGALERLERLQAAEADREVVLHGVEQPVDGPDERRAHVERRHEEDAAHGERGERQRQPRAAAKRVAQREQQRARRARDRGERAVEGRRPEAALRDPVVGERLAHGDPRAPRHRVGGGQQRDQQADEGLEQVDPGRHGEARDVEVQEHRQVAAQHAAAPDPERDGDDPRPPPRAAGPARGRCGRSASGFRPRPSSRRSGAPATRAAP